MSGIRKRSGKRKAVCPVYGFAGKGSAKLLFFLFFFCLATSAVAACAVRKTKKTPACSIEAVLEENALTIMMNYRYVHEGEKEISVLPFLLYTNAYREGAKKPVTTEDGERKVYPNGKSYMKTDILSVSSEGEDATFSVGGEDDNVLYVDLGRTLFTGEEVAVEVDYRLILPECRFRTGIWENKVNLGDWLPVCCRFSGNGFREISYSPFGDPYDQVCCDYSVELTVPSEYIVASGGKAVGTEVKGEVTAYSFDLQKGRDISFVIGKNFNVASGVANGVCVSYYTEREEFREDLELALDALDFFASSFGKYPYETIPLRKRRLRTAVWNIPGCRSYPIPWRGKSGDGRSYTKRRTSGGAGASGSIRRKNIISMKGLPSIPLISIGKKRETQALRKRYLQRRSQPISRFLNFLLS